MGEGTMNIARRTRMNFRNMQLNKFLSTFDNADEFLEFARKKFEAKKFYHSYLSYEGPRDYSLMRAAYDGLYIDFKDSSFLELGPGYGGALEIAREAGAKRIDFVDYDPYITAFNILRGYGGYFIDYLVGRGLTPLYPNKYDIILSKGSINADKFNRKESGFILFSEWIKQVENLSSPRGQIIICPTFDKGKETDDMGSYYVCKDLDAFRDSWFSKVLQGLGYEIIYVKYFNFPKRFPFTFYKKKERGQ